ncbi:hypothetical protein [Aliikangiella sp. G2MR2-5]|uniref:hypothetical protein n=1 Tax=Aliikangiella sp. G2MR2-5 TaxID=2788943 RepID=UPI0018ABB5E3|nr:hypothetical protein [Aliikangiella sp. G2MR2-5]
MKRTPLISLLFSLFVFHSFNIEAGELTREKIKGTYYLGTPERGKQQVEIDFGQLGNKYVLAVACKGCAPATYSFLKEESSTLQVATFMTAGLYVFQFSDDSFVVVQPDALLGRKVWSQIKYANIYSKNPDTAKSITKEQIQNFALDLSRKIMNQDVGKMAHSGGTYHLAVPMKHMGKAQKQHQVTFISEGQKQIDVKPCERCGVNQYKYLPEESAIAGVDIYRHATSYYLFDLKDGVLIYTFANASGLGKVLWGKNNHYNVWSNNLNYIRQLLNSKDKQNAIDKLMSNYFASIKSEFEKRAQEAHQKKVAKQELPTSGLNDNNQRKQATAAAKRWAKAWGWKESIKDAYFTSADWAITRNPLSGIITGKVIRGFVTMTHPDGRCRFQYVSFRQDYDGTQYMNFHMTGVGPVYDLGCDRI